MRALARAALAANTAGASLQALGFDGLSSLCRGSAGRFAPDARGGLDPRHALPIAYSAVRATRLVESFDTCAVCENRTCPAADIAELPGGDVAWLTPNLYPIVFPFEDAAERAAGGVRDIPDLRRATARRAGSGPAAQPGLPPELPLRGVHLVQWSSLRHDGGLIGADAATAAALFAQLARAEEFLLHHASHAFPESGAGDDGRMHRGFVGLIKNRGRRVGGSVEHDHQQVLLCNQRFAEPPLARGLQHALLAAAHADSSAALLVDDIDGLARTLVPAFMRRPLQAFVVPVNPSRPGAGRDARSTDMPRGAPAAADSGWLHHLPPMVRDATALAVARLTHAVSAAMNASGQDPAWNLVCHTGPGCGPLFELRPFTQPLGGFEHLGLYLCEERPATSAARLRESLPR